jgi:plasmid stabilization system protein ParE
MRLPLVVRRAAQQEFDEAVDWYERQRTGLGKLFAEQVQRAFENVRNAPYVHQALHKEVRRAPVHQFPNGIYYRVYSDRIRVISVFHEKRDPSIWQRRV